MIRRLLAATFAAALAAAPLAAPAAVVTVTSAAALQSAVNAAHAGDVVQCVGGPFNGLAFTGLNFTSDVTIQSAASATSAYTCTLGDFVVQNSTHLAFRTLDLAATGTPLNNNGAYQVLHSHYITFANVIFHGPAGLITTAPGSALAATFVDHLTVLHSEFHNLVNGVALSSVNYTNFEANSFHDLEIHGVAAYQTSWASFTGNRFKDFYPQLGDHVDAIIFFSTGATVSSHDLTFARNVVQIGLGGFMQGIFVTDETYGVHPYQNVNINGNLLCGTGSNAIDVSYGVNVAITGNSLYPVPGTPVWERDDHITGTSVIAGNTVGATQTDRCAAVVAAWPAYGQ